MEYNGKLYGKIGKIYFDTSKTAGDWDNLEKENEELKRLLFISGKVLNSTQATPTTTLTQIVAK